ncbi:hypothetical protein AVHY2522_13675 [Acidovorax sp. SUPP2522]|nr:MULTISPECIES: hypothetical protein [unclassified Acidovorax]WCM96261.1 hypothetical protein M5C96_17720 [Acidovorax sp. GBBC 1281]GKT16994.1 hypothetical protein AVHY2522_13675 [Acidovorax sp. SUPP2522]
MNGFRLYQLYRRAGNGPRNSLRMAVGLLWRIFNAPPAFSHRHARP